MSTASWRRLFCQLTRRHFWTEYVCARRCNWCGRIEVDRL